MVDLATFSALLGAVRNATDIATWLKESNASFEKAEQKLKLAELLSALADVKFELAEIQQLLLEKDNTIRTLEDSLRTKTSIRWESPYYWTVEDGKKDGPFCQQCYDKEQNLIRLQGHGDGYWECKTCTNTYKDKTYVVPSPMAFARTDYDPFNR